MVGCQVCEGAMFNAPAAGLAHCRAICKSKWNQPGQVIRGSGTLKLEGVVELEVNEVENLQVEIFK